MASSLQDYQNFLQWIFQPSRGIPEDVLKLACLIHTHFDAIQATSSTRSQRSALLASLMRRELSTTVPHAPDRVVGTEVSEWNWRQLSRFTLGPFRGFREPEQFDLSKKITLIYGPNGSGKSSFCEGLEFALLGEVEEAANKRIGTAKYLANIHEEKYLAPELKVVNSEGEEVNLAVNPELHRFCFIEKNRIDSFSRLAARSSGQRAELIAALFGMGPFSEFVSNFNESMDRQLILTADKSAQLALKKASLQADMDDVAREPETLASLTEYEITQSEQFSPGSSWFSLMELTGLCGHSGRIGELDTILASVPPALTGISREFILRALDHANVSKSELTHCINVLSDCSEQISFKDLYTAVSALQKTQGDLCPACNTPLEGAVHVAENPYIRASKGLEQLAGLGTLQEAQRAAEIKLNQSSSQLRQMMAKIAEFVVSHDEAETVAGAFLLTLAEEPGNTWWECLNSSHETGSANSVLREELLALADRMSYQDTQTTRSLQERETQLAERRRLEGFRQIIIVHETKKEQVINGLAEMKVRIANFDQTHAVLIQESEAEKLQIQKETPFKQAYDGFLRELRIFRDQMPGQLLTGLNDAALEFYNAFNRNDRDEDKLAFLHLPLSADDKIEICFRGQPDSRRDALHVLSEGHVRCLGLSILLAKAKSAQCPLIVFDDAINAIDHDHRAGIRETLFERGIFDDIQLLITCHSNEFIKDIQNHLPAERRVQCQSYLFRHHSGDYRPRVTGNAVINAYIHRARQSKDLLNDREALAASRQALEMLTDKIWRWMGSHDHGDITVSLAGSGAEPGLRSLCEALCKRLKGLTSFTHSSKSAIIDAFDRILSISSQNLIWTYLNKGTHEEADRDDFDSEEVEKVVMSLEELDALPLRRGR